MLLFVCMKPLSVADIDTQVHAEGQASQDVVVGHHAMVLLLIVTVILCVFSLETAAVTFLVIAVVKVGAWYTAC